MNILFFSEQSPFLKNRVGGAENSMRLMAEGLAARGHDVTYASLHPDARREAREFVKNGVRIRLCASPRRSFRGRLFRKTGLRGTALGAAFDRRAWARVRRQLFGAAAKAGRRYDVGYFFYEMEFLAEALAARDAEMTGMAIVMRMAGVSWGDDIRTGPPGTAARYAAIFNAVDAINYLSPSSRDLVEETARALDLGFAPRSSFIADIGVDAGNTAHGWRGPSEGPGLDILVATRFSPHQKRQDILIEALGLLKGRLPFKVTMIGDGATREANIRRRDALGLAAEVEIRSFAPQTELWEIMRGADLLCHPCDHEGVSKIILESMMLGLPVLASDVAPLPDYVIEGETGHRVANTPEAWAARLIGIAGEKAALPALSARARDFVETTYGAERNLDRYETRFHDLAEGVPPGA
jgi:glycosyltransferase involved in cell wall biosynthesis